MDGIRYAVMGAWRWLKYWLPKGEPEEVLINPLYQEDEEDDNF